MGEKAQLKTLLTVQDCSFAIMCFSILVRDRTERNDEGIRTEVLEDHK